MEMKVLWLFHFVANFEPWALAYEYSYLHVDYRYCTVRICCGAPSCVRVELLLMYKGAKISRSSIFPVSMTFGAKNDNLDRLCTHLLWTRSVKMPVSKHRSCQLHASKQSFLWPKRDAWGNVLLDESFAILANSGYLPMLLSSRQSCMHPCIHECIHALALQRRCLARHCENEFSKIDIPRYSRSLKLSYCSLLHPKECNPECRSSTRMLCLSNHPVLCPQTPIFNIHPWKEQTTTLLALLPVSLVSTMFLADQTSNFSNVRTRSIVMMIVIKHRERI